jgi:hypothetical protein
MAPEASQYGTCATGPRASPLSQNRRRGLRTTELCAVAGLVSEVILLTWRTETTVPDPPGIFCQHKLPGGQERAGSSRIEFTMSSSGDRPNHTPRLEARRASGCWPTAPPTAYIWLQFGLPPTIAPSRVAQLLTDLEATYWLGLDAQSIGPGWAPPLDILGADHAQRGFPPPTLGVLRYGSPLTLLMSTPWEAWVAGGSAVVGAVTARVWRLSGPLLGFRTLRRSFGRSGSRQTRPNKPGSRRLHPEMSWRSCTRSLPRDWISGST